MPREPISSESNNAVGRLLIFVLLLSLGGIVLYHYQQKKGDTYTYVPKELRLNYLPADFRLNIDEEHALEVLSQPNRRREEFNELVYQLNLSIIDHVASRMGLPDELKRQARQAYNEHHPYLRNLYYQDFVALKDTTSLIYQTWYENESTNATGLLQEVASKYTCFFVNHIFSTLLETENGSIYAKGVNVDTPCGVALTEALQPVLKRLEERAAIRDFSRSRGLLQEKTERVISELATMEVRDKKGINKTMQTRIWGYAVSSTDIEISAISILKVGFRIDQYFDAEIDGKAGLIILTLPEPVILSHEVYPKFDKLDIGWLREVRDVDLNQAFNALRTEFRREALESDIRERAKDQAVDLMNTMFTPFVQSINPRYRLEVRFQPAEDEKLYAPETNREELSN